MSEVPNGARKPGRLLFEYDPATGNLTWKQEGSFNLAILVNALELCKAVQIQRQLAEQFARQAQEEANRVQPAPGMPPGRLFRG